MNARQRFAIALAEAAGHIANLDLEQMYGNRVDHNSFKDQRAWEEAQQRVVAMLNLAAKNEG